MKKRVVLFAMLLMLALFGACNFIPDEVPEAPLRFKIPVFKP